MTVEIIRFRVPAGCADEFVRRNEEIWTPALRARDGFLGREVLRSDAHRDVLLIVIRWQSRETLDAFPADELELLEDRMSDLVEEQEQWVYEMVLPAGSSTETKRAAH